MKTSISSISILASLALITSCSSIDSNPAQNNATARAAQPGMPNYQPGTLPVTQPDNSHQGEMRSVKSGQAGSAFASY